MHVKVERRKREGERMKRYKLGIELEIYSDRTWAIYVTLGLITYRVARCKSIISGKVFYLYGLL